MAQIDRTDGLVGNAAIKYPCRMASTANLTLSGTQTIDGIVGAAGDRVLVKDQTTATQNGIYVMDSGTWERAQDADNDGAFTEGSLVKVNNGTVGQGFWYITNTGTITIDSTNIAFGRASTILAVISAFWQTVIQMTTAALSRTALGLGTGDTPTFTGVVTSGDATIGGNEALAGTLGGTNATDSTSPTTGAWKTAGGLGVAKALWVGGLANIAGTLTGADATDSTTSTTGAWKTAGGLGVAKAVNIGTTLGVTGATTHGAAVTVGGTSYAATSMLSAIQATTGQQAIVAAHSHATGPLGIAVAYTGGAPNDAGHGFLVCNDTGAVRFNLYSNGGLANFSANDVNLSDVVLKEHFTPLASCWGKWKALKFGTYLYKDQTDDIPNIGLLANDVEQVNPQLVTSVEIKPAAYSKPSEILDENGHPIDPGGQLVSPAVHAKGIYQTDVNMMMGAVLQEAMAKIEALEQRVAELEAP